MTKFFIDIKIKDAVFVDDEGTCAKDLQAAADEAQAALLDIARHHLRKAHPLVISATVCDRNGAQCTVSVTVNTTFNWMSDDQTKQQALAVDEAPVSHNELSAASAGWPPITAPSSRYRPGRP